MATARQRQDLANYKAMLAKPKPKKQSKFRKWLIRMPVVGAMLLSGCASTSMPTDVSVIPNDCANRRAIESWLVSQTQYSRSQFQSEESYENQMRSIKNRLWQFRYNCNSL